MPHGVHITFYEVTLDVRDLACSAVRRKQLEPGGTGESGTTFSIDVKSLYDLNS
jgi:hypothetical protein